MKIYLVGGAVRDQLLGLPVKEYDYVVVGATPEEMLKQGFKPVGKEFPVFLHPETKEEYALARTERKIAKGYKGFEFYAAPEVTLEEDLLRRDLTVNAIAQTESGKLIDPYHGQTDLKNKILRHVSPAFAEDPVRILRVARFAARFHEFKVHPDTVKLMRQMVHAGEVDALVPERVWQEFVRALQEKHPERFLEVLAECDALPILFPQLINSLETIKKTLQEAAKNNYDDVICFASMFANIDPDEAITLCERYKIPAAHRDLAILISKYHGNYLNALQLSAEDLLNLLEKTDAFRRPDRFEKFLTATEINQGDKKVSQRLFSAFKAAASVETAEIAKPGMAGLEIAQALRKARIKKILENG